jgi:hypothetical protein
MDLSPLESIAGAALVFFLPGYALTKATFPEWRVRGAERIERALEIVTLAFVLSLVLTILIGFVLLNSPGAGFSASWSDPRLEIGLAAVTGAGLVAAALRGAFRRVPPEPVRAREEAEAGLSTWEFMREMETLQREERRVRHALRTAERGSVGERDLRHRLEELVRTREELVARQEAAVVA